MRILFLTHYYPPESNAPANRVSEMARAWVAAGHAVTVVTVTPNHPGGRPYPGYHNRLFQQEIVDGVDVIRLGILMAPNEGVARRSLSYLSYLIAVALNLWRLPKVDIVVSTSPQFFAGLAGAVVAWAKRAPWVLEIRDIWPESVAAVGALRKGFVTGLLEQLEAWAYRTADQLVVVSPAFVDHIEERGPLKRAAAVIENGVDLALFDGAGNATAFRERHGLTGKVVFGYVGTHGMAHGLDTVLEAAALTQDDPAIAWLLVGSGAERARLLEIKAARGLSNVTMLDHQPRSAMPEIWSATEVSLVVLRASPLFLRVIPSKMFEAMAMSRPMLLAVDGMARRIMDEAGAGVFVPPGDAEALARAARQLAGDAGLRERLGRSGRVHVAERYDRSLLAARYLDILKTVARRTG